MKKKAILCTTGDIPNTAKQCLSLEMSTIMPLENIPIPSFRSASSNQPSFIQILAHVEIWAPLTIAASKFLSQIAKRAADDVWDRKKEIAAKLNIVAVTQFKKFVEALDKAHNASCRIPSIIIGIPLPDDRFGTTLRFQAEDENDIAWFVANFLAKAETVEKVLQEEMTGKYPPMAPVQLKLQEDGSFIMQWMDRDELNEHKRKIE